MHKFFVSADSIIDGKVLIEGNDARHISFSLRMKRGDKLCLATDDLKDCFCTIVDFIDGKVLVKVDSVKEACAESPCRISLFQAIPKGDKFETIIQKAVECGVYSVTPFQSAYCISKINDSEKKLERWNRIALEAAKQCGRSIVPKVFPPISYKEAIKEASGSELSLFCYENEHTNKLGNVLNDSNAKTISVVVGSEGGFSQQEAEFATENGLLPISLGPRILRCETASAFVLACISLVKELFDRK